MDAFRDDWEERNLLNRQQLYPDHRDNREWLQTIKLEQLSGDRDDPNPFAFQDSGNTFANRTKKWRSTNVFITSFLFIIKSSLSDSTTGRTPKEKFCRLDEVLIQEYDMDQAPLSSEIKAEPKMFHFVFVFFFSVFSGVEHWEFASIMPKWCLEPSDNRADS